MVGCFNQQCCFCDPPDFCGCKLNSIVIDPGGHCMSCLGHNQKKQLRELSVLIEQIGETSAKKYPPPATPNQFKKFKKLILNRMQSFSPQSLIDWGTMFSKMPQPVWHSEHALRWKKLMVTGWRLGLSLHSSPAGDHITIGMSDHHTNNELKTTDKYKADRNYWMKRIDTLPIGPDLPLSVQPEKILKPTFERCTKVIDMKVWNAFKDI